MSRITKIELEQRLAAALSENERMRQRVLELEGTVSALKSREQRAETPKPVYQPKPTPDWVLARRQAMAQAKALAMKAGKTISVELSTGV